MSNVNADATQLLTILKNMRTSISSIETTRSSVKMKYQQLGIGWNDKKYDELGTIVKDCNKALNDILQIMLQAEKYVASLAKSVQEYDNVNLDTPSARNSFLQGLQTPNVGNKAKENTSYCPKKVKVKIIHDPAPNAFALGRQTLCITDGLLLLSDDMILGILAHEIGHLSYGHTVIQLLIGGGNIFISGCLLLIKISYWIFSAIMGLFAICSRSGVMGIITAVFAGISTALSWLWVKFCMLFLMWSMRQNEYLADEFAYKIGFGLELATVLDQHISDVPHDGFLSAIYSTHPCNDDRVAALQNLGVPYSRY